MPFGPRSVYLIISVLLLVIGYFDGRRILKRRPELTIDNILHKIPYILPAVILILIAVVPLGVINSNQTLLWMLPLPLQAVAPQLFWGGVLIVASYIVGLSTSVGFITQHPKRRMMLIAAFCLEGSLIVTLAKNYEPAAPYLLAEIDKDGVIRQTRSYSCAPAACANLLKKLGKTTTEQDMAEFLGTTVKGTTPAQIFYGLSKMGFECTLKEIQPKHDPSTEETYCRYEEITPPAILFVDDPTAGPEGHAVLYWKNDKHGNAIILDSLHGQWKWEPLSLGKVWRGHAIECKPVPSAKR